MTEQPAPAAPAAPPPQAAPIETGTQTAAPEASAPADTPLPTEATPAVQSALPVEAVTYTDFSAPEGVLMDQDIMTEFKAAGIDAGISQQQAQKLVDLGVKLQGNIEERIETQKAEQLNKWQEDARNDSEIGGDKLDENLSIAKKAVDMFASPELVEILNTSGMGNHPEMIRVFLNIGKKISEDGVFSGGGSPNGDKTIAQRMYPGMNP